MTQPLFRWDTLCILLSILISTYALEDDHILDHFKTNDCSQDTVLCHGGDPDFNATLRVPFVFAHLLGPNDDTQDNNNLDNNNLFPRGNPLFNGTLEQMEALGETLFDDGHNFLFFSDLLLRDFPI